MTVCRLKSNSMLIVLDFDKFIYNSKRRWDTDSLFKSLSSIHLIFAKKTSWDETCTWIERSSKDYDCMILYYVKWLLRWVTIMLSDYYAEWLWWVTLMLNDYYAEWLRWLTCCIDLRQAFSIADTWILEKRRQFYSMHTSSTHDHLQTQVNCFQRKSSD